MKSLLLVLFVWSAYVMQAQTGNTIGLLLNSEKAYDGYTLFSTLSGKQTYLIDNCGKVTKRWISDYPSGLSSYITPQGKMLRAGRINSGFSGGGIGGLIELYDVNGGLEWTGLLASSTYTQHHDIEPLPNGNILVLIWEIVTREDAESLGWVLQDNLEEIWSESILEIKPIGSSEYEVVWRWDIKDHLVQDVNSSLDNYGVISEHPERLDPNYNINNGISDRFHANSIDYNSERDQIILNIRNTSEFVIIDHSTTTEEAATSEGGNSGKGGDFLYRYGNPQIYNRGTETDRKFYLQHGARWIKTDGPYKDGIIVFNNGVDRPQGSFSSVEIVMPTWDGNLYFISENAAFGPEEFAFAYVGTPVSSFYSSRISSAQVLPNNNILICEGQEGHLFEINQDKQVIWEYIVPLHGDIVLSQGDNPPSADVFMAERYAPDYIGFDGIDIQATFPIEKHSSYDCDLYSSISRPNAQRTYTIVNTLVNDQLYIDNPDNQELMIQVYDMSGQLMLSQIKDATFIMLNLPMRNGMYIVQIADNNQIVNTTKIIKI